MEFEHLSDVHLLQSPSNGNSRKTCPTEMHWVVIIKKPFIVLVFLTSREKCIYFVSF